MSLTTLTLRYALFAAIATVLNLAAQRLSLGAYAGEGALALAIGAGTAVGLVAKYLLDKRWIFQDAATGLAGHSRRFGLYTCMGFFTTLIFWGMEAGFWIVWQTDTMREIGAALGLAIGYVIKYRLDRRFVFAPGAVA